jgi:FMN phosphatase YigB (HAD superfamily)
MIKYVFFDLDGTLLPMNQDDFIKGYLESLTRKLASYGYEPTAIGKAIYSSVFAMIKNDGSITNEHAFWNNLKLIYGDNARDNEQIYIDYYQNEFEYNKKNCWVNEKSKIVIDKIKDLGLKMVLATNPLFPKIATDQRIAWAGIDKNIFELITTYENSSYCKPNIKYYEEILGKLGANPKECLMVGNDALEDTVTLEIGMKAFLLTDCLINTKDIDINKFKHGGFDDLLNYIYELLKE